MTDPLHKLLVEALDIVVKRESEEAREGLDQVRAEIKRKGSHWASDVIWTLRRQVAALEKRLAEKEQGES